MQMWAGAAAGVSPTFEPLWLRAAIFFGGPEAFFLPPKPRAELIACPEIPSGVADAMRAPGRVARYVMGCIIHV